MAGRKQKDAPEKRKKGGRFLPALCNVLGTLLLVGVIGLAAPLTVPQLAGYQVYDVVSGSMEPEIPVGSAVYVKSVEPAEVQEGEVVAYQYQGGTVVHRVTVNRTSLGEFVTKGDANEVEDFEPIPYEAVLGRVETHIPVWGAFMAIYASSAGKVYLLLTAACGVMLNLLASRMREARRARQLQAQFAAVAASGEGAAGAGVGVGAGTGAPGGAQAAGEGAAAHASTQAASKRRGSFGRKLKWAAVMVLAVVFLGSGGVIGYVTWQYAASDALYDAASDRYTRGAESAGEKPPIDVDFAELCAQNPDVVGWIYCADTPINYPVLHSRDNDQYLHHDYTGAYNIDGSIFVDSENSPGFVDGSTIIYGHNMNSGSMFAALEKWADQAFYEEHPTMWLLTPTQNYKVILFSGHHADAYGSMYDIIRGQGVELDGYLGQALVESGFTVDERVESIEPQAQEAIDAAAKAKEAAEAAAKAAAEAAQNGTDPASAQAAAAATATSVRASTQFSQLLAKALLQTDHAGSASLSGDPHYVMLTTCAYLFNNDRYVVHGLLLPVGR